MNKKFGYIFLGLGIILLIVYFITSSTTSSDSNKIPNKDSTTNKIIYDYVKSHDINKKEKISFPIYNNLTLDDNKSDDFYKLYASDSGYSVSASIIAVDGTIEEYIDNFFDWTKNLYEELGYTVTRENVNCQYRCERIKVVGKDNNMFLDELKLFMDISSSERLMINLRGEKKELTKDMIDLLNNDIKITNDATYTIGKVSDNQLIIDLKMNDNKKFNIKLDSNIYSEIENKDNSIRVTTVKNINNNSTINLIIRHKFSYLSFDYDIANTYSNKEFNVKPNEVNINDIIFNKYNFENSVIYAYFIDDDTAFIVKSEDKTIEINDFIDFMVKDK